jgi:tetratricopeptide (TPR) repeat protein
MASALCLEKSPGFYADNGLADHNVNRRKGCPNMTVKQVLLAYWMTQFEDTFPDAEMGRIRTGHCTGGTEAVIVDWDRRSRWFVCILLSFLLVVGMSANAIAQNKQGLGPGGTRLTEPPKPTPSGTGFGPNTGFGPSTGFGSSSSSSSGNTPPGTVCVSIQCADGTVVPCNSSCPHPGTQGSPVFSAPPNSGSGSGDGVSAPAQSVTWEAILAANKRGLEAFNSGDYESAAQYFRRALTLNPDNATLKKNLQDAEVRLREKRERERALSEDTVKVENIINKLATDFGTAPQGDRSPFDNKFPPRSDGDSRVVDLSFMDPTKPMIVEPRKVQGQTPAQTELGFMDPNKPAPADRLKDAPASKPSEKSEKEVKAEAAFALATLSVKHANYDQALRFLQDAHEAKPNDKKILDAYKYIVTLKFTQMQIKLGEKANFLLDALDYGKGDWEKSLDYLSLPAPVLDLDSSSYAWKAAKANLKQAYAEFLARQAVDRVNRKDFEGAIKSLKRAEELDPDTDGVRSFLSVVADTQ